MRVLGIDFTSRPTPRKPITCCECQLDGARLHALRLIAWDDFAGFERTLREPGPWVAGLDFPFGQSRRFIETIGWPESWAGYVRHAAGLGRDGFRECLKRYRAPRAAGDKEHKRTCDRLAGASSPQKIEFPPVGLMFFEGAPRLLASGATVLGLHAGDTDRIAVEAYPALVAQALIGRRGYKHDTRARQTAEQETARRALLDALRGPAFAERYRIIVDIPPHLDQQLVLDAAGDRIDALFCAVQAAWTWARGGRDHCLMLPTEMDSLEGWILDPRLLRE